MTKAMILTKAVPVFEEAGDLVAAYLFGSRENGDFRPQSDADFGVLFHGSIDLSYLIRIQQKLEDTLGLRVDLIDLRSAGSFLALDIIRGIRFLCKDETLCDEFELFVLSRAGDLAFIERQRRALLLHGEIDVSGQ